MAAEALLKLEKEFVDGESWEKFAGDDGEILLQTLGAKKGKGMFGSSYQPRMLYIGAANDQVWYYYSKEDSKVINGAVVIDDGVKVDMVENSTTEIVFTSAHSGDPIRLWELKLPTEEEARAWKAELQKQSQGAWKKAKKKAAKEAAAAAAAAENAKAVKQDDGSDVDDSDARKAGAGKTTDKDESDGEESSDEEDDEEGQPADPKANKGMFGKICCF